MDLVLNNLERLICHKTKQTNNQTYVNTNGASFEGSSCGQTIRCQFQKFSQGT